MNRINSPEKKGLGLGSNLITPFYKPDEPDTLHFDSVFESGNLAKVFRITGHFYELHLRPDLYTTKHCQWYYFSVTNMQINTTYR